MMLTNFSLFITTFLITSQITSCAPTDDFMMEALLTHNEYRAKHHVGNFTWSNNLAKFALQKCETCVWGYQKRDNMGENIAYGYPSIKDAVEGWYSEWPMYNFDNDSTDGRGASQFTQIVWKNTTEIGCAASYCKELESVYYVCNYGPAGNVANEFSANVLQP